MTEIEKEVFNLFQYGKQCPVDYILRRQIWGDDCDNCPLKKLCALALEKV